MKKSFEYDLTKYDPNAPTKTEEFLTADGVKTLTTDANNGAVLIQDTVDEDSLNPVTAAAVATAIEQGGGGSGVPDVANPLYVNPDDEVALRFGSGLTLEVGEAVEDDTLAVSLSGTGGLYYDETDDNALAVQLDPAGGLECVIDDGVQVGLKVKTDGATIDINADGELEAIGGGGGGSLPTPTNTAQLLGVNRNQSSQLEPAWVYGNALEQPLNVAGANTWHAKSNAVDGSANVEWTVTVSNNVITLTPDNLIVPNDRASHLYIQFPAMLQQLSSSWTGGLIHADVDFKYKCTDLDPNGGGEYAYDRHRVVRVTQYEATQWPQLQIAAELLITNQDVGIYSTWKLFDSSKNCGISQVTITITDDSGNALPVYADTADFPVVAWLD